MLSKKILNNSNNFWEELTEEKELTLHLELEVKNQADFKIQINDSIVYDSVATESITIKYPYKDQKEIDLSMWMHSKTQDDTKVDQEGNILDDKYIKIKRFIVNNFDLKKDFDFFYNQFSYHNNNKEQPVKEGFWFNNDVLSLKFTAPFIRYYLDNSNSKNSDKLISYRNSISTDDLFFEIIESLDLLKD